MAQPSVTILGAGIAGLTLSRALRSKGVPSIIYDRASSAPRHTYGITLHKTVYQPLAEILGLDEDQFKSQLAVDSFHNNGHGNVKSATAGFRANRQKLEAILSEDTNIQREHKLVSASNADKDAVSLEFENGSKMQPKLVIDTTGVHSPLRKSLLPTIEPEVQPFAVYSSKRWISPSTFSSTYAPAFGSTTLLTHYPSASVPARLEISLNGARENNDVSISYIYSRPAHDSKSNQPDHLARPDRDIAGANTTPDALFDEIEALHNTSSPLPSPWKECFDPQTMRADRILHWLMRTVLVSQADLEALLKRGIVVIGDAAHAVPILGGHGANLAIADALALADVLAAEVKGEKADGLKEYYEKHWAGWRDAVEESKREIAAMHEKNTPATAVLSCGGG